MNSDWFDRVRVGRGGVGITAMQWHDTDRSEGRVKGAIDPLEIFSWLQPVCTDLNVLSMKKSLKKG